jgi:hypothetical protein
VSVAARSDPCAAPSVFIGEDFDAAFADTAFDDTFRSIALDDMM